MTNGKVALVTGASRGIGRACAIKLGEAGYKVAVNYNSNEAAANEVVEKIKAAGSEAVAEGLGNGAGAVGGQGLQVLGDIVLAGAVDLLAGDDLDR